MKSFAAVAASALALASSVLASPTPVGELVARQSSKSLPPVTVKGNAFWTGNTRFYMRGVDYQPGGSSLLADPLADVAVCTRDIAQFKALGVNTIRIYTVDNTADHTVCMQALADAGIYLVLDVNSPLYSINRADPAPSYNSVYLQNVFATIDVFAQYPHVLAFFSANEVINDDATTACAPYVKAVTRDMRQYIGSRGYRKIPVGYSAADVSSNRMEMAAYMNCGTDDARSDFFAFNDYSWCDPSTFKTSGWDQKVKNFTGYSIPIFLSEFGCIKPGPRKFTEVASIFSTDMSSVYSGGLAYEYSEEALNAGYGLGKIVDAKTYTPTAGFNYLKAQFAAVVNPSGDGGYLASGKPSVCPEHSSTWNVTSGGTLPMIPSAAAAFMKDGAGAPVGLKGPGSQTAGGTSTGDAPPGSGSVTAVASNGASVASGSAATTSTSKAASPGPIQAFDQSPFIVSAIFGLCTLVGTMLL